MKISLQEYAKIIKVGDKISTNANGSRADEDIIVTGTVSEIRDNYFYIKGTYDDGSGEISYCDSWSVNIPGNLAWVEIESKTKKSVKPTTKKKVYIKLDRDENGIFIEIKVPEEIEKYYTTVSKGLEQQSKVWFNAKTGEGTVFYKLNDETLMSERRIDSNVFSDFGGRLVDSERINTAILRIKGISNGIKVTSPKFIDTNNIEMQYYIKYLSVFIKKLWESSIGQKTIKSVITYEI